MLNVYITIEGGTVTGVEVPEGVCVTIEDADLEAIGEDPISVWTHEPEPASLPQNP